MLLVYLSLTQFHMSDEIKTGEEEVVATEQEVEVAADDTAEDKEEVATQEEAAE